MPANEIPANKMHVCFNCFRERPDLSENSDGRGPCPHCGFDLEENVKKFPVALRAGTVLNNRYIVGRVLGQGGFGITYLAWDEKLSAKVAVKEYMPNEIAARIGTTVSVAVESRTEDFTYGAERFKEEAKTLAKFMGQPNIAGVTDYFDENDTSYFVMDYIEGISFKTYIANAGGRVSAQEALDVMIPVLRALTAVHEEGLVHRDVTPDNIYITKDGNVKLLDFGSARYSLGDKSKSLDVILKVGYAPKEQYIRRGRQGPYTDVYSCAACLYAAITGYLPPESLERLDHDELVPPSAAGVEIPLYLERAILKGLAVQPEDRFQTAGEFLKALESQQVVEAPAPLKEEKTGRKKVSPLMAGGIAAAAAAVFILGSVFGGGGRQPGEGSPREVSGAAGEGAAAGAFAAETEAPKVTIAGTEYSTDLDNLDLSGQSLTDADLTSLGQMRSLKNLTLDGSGGIPDLTPLADLDTLERLVIEEGELQDLSPLSGLTQLRVLKLLTKVTAEDLTGLKNLTNLQELRLDSYGIQSLRGLENMVHLQSLEIRGDLGCPFVQDLSPLSGLTELKALTISVNGQRYDTDFASLSGLTQMECLDVPGGDGTKGLDLTPLAGMKNLQILRTGCNIIDLSPLSGLTHLRELELDQGGFGSTSDNVEYDSLEPLAGLTELQYLIIRNKHVSDLSPLSGLTNLQSLTIHNGRSITDVTPLAALPNLKSLTISAGPQGLDTSALTQVPDIQVSDY